MREAIRQAEVLAAGIEQLVTQFVKGDPRARRDLFAFADKLGVDLLAGQQQAIKDALIADHEAILQAYVERQYDKVSIAPPVFAPPELLDDDPEDPKKTQPQKKN